MTLTWGMLAGLGNITPIIALDGARSAREQANF
jgi:hypothetical protein